MFNQRNIKFCARLDRCGCASAEVKRFIRSGASEQIIEQRLSSAALAQLRALGAKAEKGSTLRLRLVRVVLSTGSIEGTYSRGSARALLARHGVRLQA